jgi:3-phosphoglycerate kinase
LLEEEIDYLRRSSSKTPSGPFVAILGGAKVSTSSA